MNVLITNDDGYGAWGIEALINSISKKHKVFVMAPDSNRSGASNHINLDKPLSLCKKAPDRWTSSGTPADCVITSLKSNIFPEKIDAVVSGINKGANIGTDIIYSGTCGASRQAVLYGIPGIAVSMQLEDKSKDWNDKNNWYFDKLADFVSDNLEKLCSLCVVTENGLMPKERSVFVNVNAFSIPEFKGTKFTDVCFREYIHDRVELKDNSFEVSGIFWGGDCNSKSRNYSDYDACSSGYISISRIYSEPVTVPPDSNLDSIKFSL